jgi:hypothetical protein
MTHRMTLSATLLVLLAAPAAAQVVTTEQAPVLDGAEPGAAPPSAPVIAEGGYGTFGNVAVASLVGQNVVAVSGENVGEIERLVAVDGKVLAVIGIGGFLGFGEHDVALPITELADEEGALKLQSLARADLEEMEEWDGAGEELLRETTVSGAPLDPANGLPVSE